MGDTRQADDAPDGGPEQGLILYQYAGCPFCTRVQHAAAALGLDLETRDTLMDGDSGRELVEATGRTTVPVLRIEEPDGRVRWMPESADIVAYLRARFG